MTGKGSAGPCEATMESRAVPGHTHVCVGGHGAEDHHKCGDQKCRRWFSPGATTVVVDPPRAPPEDQPSTKLRLRRKTDPPRWVK